MSSLCIHHYTGGAEEKARMMFNMYDLRGNGQLTVEEFRKMIK